MSNHSTKLFEPQQDVDPIDMLHDMARDFLSSLGFLFEGEFYETHEKEVIKYKVPKEDGRGSINCWLKCSYPERGDGTPGLCLTYGAHHPSLPAHDTKTFWLGSDAILCEESLEAIKEKRAQWKRKAKERAKERELLDNEKADWCLKKYKVASKEGISPYFSRKGISPPPFEIRYESRKTHDNGAEETVALIPLRNIRGQIRALQEIYPTKRKIKEAEKKQRDKNTLGSCSGCFFVFGELKDDKRRILIFEGFSSAASGFWSTNLTSVMAVNRTGLLTVADALRKKYKTCEIVICGDDDVDTEGNPGRKDAENAARKMGCRVCFPVFPAGKERDEQGNAYKDFNDLMLVAGQEEVKTQIESAAVLEDQVKECERPETHSKAQESDVHLLRSEEDEQTDTSEEEKKAKVNARRRALMRQDSKEIIVQEIRRQYPTISDKAKGLVERAIQWAESFKEGCVVCVNGISKKITTLDSLNMRFAQLEAPGKPCVRINQSDAQPITNTDFINRLSGEVVIAEVSERGEPKYTAASTFWSGNTLKKVYRNIVFTNQRVENDTYNLFAGFGVQPKSGRCDKILLHIKEVICTGREVDYETILKLLSWQLKNIGKPSRVIVLLISEEKQVGKGTFCQDIMMKMYGNSGYQTGDIDQVVGRFNDTIRGKAYIFLDEALYSGNKKAADAIKSLSTSTLFGIETKNIPTVQLPIGLNFFLTTNHDDAAYVEEGDARYWILKVSPHRQKDNDYFNALYEEINDGGVEAFMDYLLKLDVSGFVPARDVPQNNQEKKNMIRNSINPYDARKWLEECCVNGVVAGFRPVDENSKLPWEPWMVGVEYDNSVFSAAYAEWQRTVKSPVAPKPTPINKFGEMLNIAGFELRIQGSKRWRTLPSSEDCRAKVTEMIENGIKQKEK